MSFTRLIPKVVDCNVKPRIFIHFLDRQDLWLKRESVGFSSILMFILALYQFYMSILYVKQVKTCEHLYGKIGRLSRLWAVLFGTQRIIATQQIAHTAGRLRMTRHSDHVVAIQNHSGEPARSASCKGDSDVNCHS